MIEITYTNLYLIGVIAIVCLLYLKEKLANIALKVKTVTVMRALAEGRARFVNVTDDGFELEAVKGEK
jgi:hypothetical protein